MKSGMRKEFVMILKRIFYGPFVLTLFLGNVVFLHYTFDKRVEGLDLSRLVVELIINKHFQSFILSLLFLNIYLSFIKENSNS